MRDLTKSRLEKRIYDASGNTLMQLRISKSKKCGEQKLWCYMVSHPGTTLHAPRWLGDMRLSQLREAAQHVAHKLTEHAADQVTAEFCLDLIYAELNRRLNKGK